MPPLIAFAGALGGLAVVRWAYRTAVRVNRELEEARLAPVAEAARLFHLHIAHGAKASFAAEGHGAHAQRGNFQAAGAQKSIFHS